MHMSEKKNLSCGKPLTELVAAAWLSLTLLVKWVIGTIFITVVLHKVSHSVLTTSLLGKFYFLHSTAK